LVLNELALQDCFLTIETGAYLPDGASHCGFHGGVIMKFTRTLLAGAFVLGSSAFAFADPIEGMWKTGDDVLLKISKCGGDFCVDVADGDYVGKRSGKLSTSGSNTYQGTLKQFSTGISFTGTATLNGNSMNLVAKKFGVTVKTDNWARQ
jgi:uncharacterized protein (DUF2147 family)